MRFQIFSNNTDTDIYSLLSKLRLTIYSHNLMMEGERKYYYIIAANRVMNEYTR